MEGHSAKETARPLLTVRDLAVGYEGRRIVEGIFFTAMPGQILSLAGPNGAGKTTILKTLMGQLPPLGGSVLYRGRNLFSIPRRDLAKRIAAVLTLRPEAERMTCWEVAASGRYPYTGALGILSPEDQRKVQEALDLVRAGEFQDREFRQVSDGQRQRVLLARSVCQEPEILLLDEPTAFLDIGHKLHFLHLLRTLARERGFAVIGAIHEVDLAQKYSDRVICVRSGRAERIGPPEEVLTGEYPERLYGLEYGRYYAPLGILEPEGDRRPPKVFVLGGGGAGIPVYRKLYRLGIPFAAGVLSASDLETPVAEALASVTVQDAGRAENTREDVVWNRALSVLCQCRFLILCADCTEPMGEGQRRFIQYARDRGMLLDPVSL